jgi:anti-anti-sigma factor
MEVNIVTEQNNVQIRLKGRFDFSAHREFRTASDNALEIKGIHKISVDLSGVDYLDSSALGMLLILRDKAQATNKNIELTNARQSVAQVLEIANFKNLFTIV